MASPRPPDGSALTALPGGHTACLPCNPAQWRVLHQGHPERRWLQPYLAASSTPEAALLPLDLAPVTPAPARPPSMAREPQTQPAGPPLPAQDALTCLSPPSSHSAASLGIQQVPTNRRTHPQVAPEVGGSRSRGPSPVGSPRLTGSRKGPLEPASRPLCSPVVSVGVYCSFSQVSPLPRARCQRSHLSEGKLPGPSQHHRQDRG